MYDIIGNIPFWYKSDDNSVSLYSSVRMARNFKSVNFPSTGEYNSFKQVEKRVEIILEPYIENGSVIKKDMSSINQMEILWLQKFRILPDKRNDILAKMKLYYHKKYQTFLLTNYIEHLTFFSHTGGKEIKKAYNNCKGFADIFETADISRDVKGNYHTSSLDYFGSGLKCFSVLTLPALRFKGNFTDIISSLELNLISTKDYFSITDHDLIVITNKDSLSKKPKDVVSNFIKILDELNKVSDGLSKIKSEEVEELKQKCLRNINYDFLTFKSFMEIYYILSFLRINGFSEIKISELNGQLGLLINDSPKTLMSGGLKKSVIRSLIENVNINFN